MVRVPRYLHEPVKIIFFDQEDIMLLGMGYVLWLLAGTIYVIPISVLVPYLLIRYKKSKPRGYLRHLLYAFGFSKMKGYPLPTTTDFHE